MRLLPAAESSHEPRHRPHRVAQRLEDLSRFALLRFVVRTTRLMSGRGDRISAAPQRVLFICEDAIGDLLLTLPTIQAIAESRPGTTVDLVTSEYSVDLIRHLPYINRVIVFPRHDKRRLAAALTILRHGPYDAVVDGMVLRSHARTRSIAMMAGARADAWIGESGRTNDHVYTIRVDPWDTTTTHAERMMQLARPFTNEVNAVSYGPPRAR